MLDLMKSKPHATVICLNQNEKIVGAFPPCGVIPNKRFSAYVAPLGFISNSHEDTYYIFRSMYCKYFCYLNSISSHPQSILTQCKLFEDLLNMFEPELCYHLEQLDISPINTAFHWINQSFVGVLEVDQIYILWDRVLGFETVEIITVLAVAIFVFRANLLLNCSNKHEYQEMFSDLSTIKVLPLL